MQREFPSTPLIGVGAVIVNGGRVTGGVLLAASDADAVRWVERAEWNSHSALQLDPITVRVIEAGWQQARECGEKEQEGR
jgi:hypothetical protein